MLKEESPAGISNKKLKPRRIPQHHRSDCFGCSPNNAHGLQLDFWLSDHGCYSHCSIPNHFCGFNGLAHGGIIATLLDEVAAWANVVHFQRIAVTMEATVRYLKPVPTATELLLEGKIINHQEKHSKVASSIRSMEGEMLATCESQWLFPSYAAFAKAAGVDESTLQKLVEQMMEPLKHLLADSKVQPD
ncbi:MAG: PaaI family thioesterase [Candidatus Heimdallarchaeota archaeon]